ncbi:CzcE family metal-binding protein [Cupriavidus sp. CV2]|uniref:CzcE family metal-binding protein n=1 Tax=Cupriavidus ulmosensis TaxID=3065913 RepID=UPI00296B3C03|nr:CzcE family metal-binding protein [Cupriavidus sp. CV2]MDW3688991.1 CzcE family metal-binding protein [Cupriavidus sp. CV2]
MNVMKTILGALAVSLIGIPVAWSADKAKTNAGDNWAQHVQQQSHEQAPSQPMALSLTPANRVAALYGSRAAVATAARTILLSPGMKYVNVASGETVAFQSGSQTTAWTFAEIVHGSSTDLGAILPGMSNAQGVRVYIDRSRLFTGG